MDRFTGLLDPDSQESMKQDINCRRGGFQSHIGHSSPAVREPYGHYAGRRYATFEGASKYSNEWNTRDYTSATEGSGKTLPSCHLTYANFSVDEFEMIEEASKSSVSTPNTWANLENVPQGGQVMSSATGHPVAPSRVDTDATTDQDGVDNCDLENTPYPSGTCCVYQRSPRILPTLSTFFRLNKESHDESNKENRPPPRKPLSTIQLPFNNVMEANDGEQFVCTICNATSDVIGLKGKEAVAEADTTEDGESEEAEEKSATYPQIMNDPRCLLEANDLPWGHMVESMETANLTRHPLNGPLPRAIQHPLHSQQNYFQKAASQNGRELKNIHDAYDEYIISEAQIRQALLDDCGPVR